MTLMRAFFARDKIAAELKVIELEARIVELEKQRDSYQRIVKRLENALLRGKLERKDSLT